RAAVHDPLQRGPRHPSGRVLSAPLPGDRRPVRGVSVGGQALRTAVEGTGNAGPPVRSWSKGRGTGGVAVRKDTPSICPSPRFSTCRPRFPRFETSRTRVVRTAVSRSSRVVFPARSVRRPSPSGAKAVVGAFAPRPRKVWTELTHPYESVGT